MAFKDVNEFLQGCTDEEIFKIEINIGEEIFHRLIDLLKSHGCTSVYVKDEGAGASVNDTYGAHRFSDDILDKWVDVEEVGYTNYYEGGEVYPNILYIRTVDGEHFAGDEINECGAWDLYHSVREYFSKYDKNDKRRS